MLAAHKCIKAEKTTCKILSDTKTNFIYIDGELVYRSDGLEPADPRTDKITFEIDDCASSLTIYAFTSGFGCLIGGVSLECSGGNIARWGKVNSDNDYLNWRVHGGYFDGAQAASSRFHFFWPKASRVRGGYAKPGICGPGSRWTFRRDMPSNVPLMHMPVFAWILRLCRLQL